MLLARERCELSSSSSQGSAQIADVCEEAGLDGLTDDLVMSYQRDDGSYATVTRSVPLEAIVEAPTLRLKPAKSKRGRK